MSKHQAVALKYEVEEIGKCIKGSKRRHLWTFSIAQRVYNLVLEESVVSGKNRLSINGKLFHSTVPTTLNKTLYNHSFVISDHRFSLSQTGQQFQLRIDNNTFSHLLQSRKNAEAFQNHEFDQNDFTLQESTMGGKQKITMALPGFNPMKKKKGAAAQSDNWNQFVKDSSFPNYFGEHNEEKKQEQQKQEMKVAKHEEFNTMQNMFKTVVDSGTYQQKEKEGQTPVYNIDQIPAIPQINLQEFNTMQSLFQTISPQGQNQKPAKNQNNMPNQHNFNTMQSLFNTMSPTQQQIQVTKQAVQAKTQINMQDFNTMQSLFKTMNPFQNQPEKQMAKQQQKVQTNKEINAAPSLTINEQGQLAGVNMNDFNTIQNLFKTMNPGNMTEKQTTKTQQPTIAKMDLGNINTADFSTMQHLFATNTGMTQFQANKTQEFSTAQKCPQLILQPLKHTSSQEQPTFDFSKVNVADFNTMQQMFSTNMGLTLQNSSRDNLGAQMKQSGGKQEPNASDFNTMQNLFGTMNGKKENMWQL